MSGGGVSSIAITGGNSGLAPDLSFPEKEERDLSFAEEELQSGYLYLLSSFLYSQK
jgi:hypothetical protein